MELISSHLDKSKLNLTIHKVNSICAFTGESITEGVLLKDLIKTTFTDHEFIKFNSLYSSINIALMLENWDGRTGLRNFSFYADENELILLKREHIQEKILNIEKAPFQLGITFSGKKHISFKAPVNFDKNNFKIITDLGIVNFEKEKVIDIIEIVQNWYTAIPDKKDTVAQPTYFTKDQIKGISIPNHKQISSYGIHKYFQESNELDKYRGTSLLNLIIYFLNKKI